jgi:hypothetical protein
MATFRTLPLFALEGQRHSGEPFLVVEDPSLIEAAAKLPFRVKLEDWKSGAAPSAQANAPAFILMGELGDESRILLPDACLIASADYPNRAPYIWWNSSKDLTVSKYNHVSNQAFYLRRYARRVAALWEQKYGRRPVVNAYTSVSLNNRPPQPLVDPRTDLASVPVTYFGHNSWINDLEVARVPREQVKNGTVY